MPESNPTLHRIVMALTEDGADALLRIVFEPMSNAALVKAYEARGGECGVPVADIVWAEMARREVDF